MTRSIRARRMPLSARMLGVVLLVAMLVFALYAFNRPRIDTSLASGEKLDANFSRDYKLIPYQSVVKLAGVKVGSVTGVDDRPDAGSTVSMKLDNGTLAKLGTAPRATIRPALLLGGNYYVELTPGAQKGSASSTVPVARTAVPVELDRVLQAFTPSTQQAIQGTIGSLQKTMGKPGRDAVQGLLGSAPAALAPTGQVLTAAEGSNPQTDLTSLVVGAERIGATLSAQQGQLASILTSLDTTTSALAAQRVPLSDAIRQAPTTLSTTRTGLADLDTSLDKLTTTASSFRPAAQRLAPLLDELDPTLATAQPVIADARKVAADARPLVARLVPTAQSAQSDLSDVQGNVLQRANGPLLAAVLAPWHGTGVYAGGGNDHPLYKEAGYLLSHTADVFKFHDAQGAAGRLMAGVGLNSVNGIGQMSLEQYLESLGIDSPAGPQEGQGTSVGGLVTLPTVGGSKSASGSSSGSTKSKGTAGQGLLSSLLLPLVGGH